MNRRGFLGFLGSLPFVRKLKSKPKLEKPVIQTINGIDPPKYGAMKVSWVITDSEGDDEVQEVQERNEGAGQE